ncbi:unnamed protein product [Phytophthora fragariaefolia]|uniref:Unnamed protein product n=1 Tax=Phytophthora fragariaefolia TaxID=1490495 RepID=A0A9W6XMZ6_9STRA|nr:unnamed protein product [Phytophthora fragariaefolia]
MVKGSISLTTTLSEPCVKPLGVLLSSPRWADIAWKKLLLFTRSTKDFSLELQYPSLAGFIQKYFSDVDQLRYLTDPLFVASWIERMEEFVQPVHTEHSKDRPCRSIFCSLEREANKTEQQLEFDDQSRKLPRGTSARRAAGITPFLEMAKLIKAHVRGPELMEVRSKSIRIVCEIDNLSLAPLSSRNQEGSSGNN